VRFLASTTTFSNLDYSFKTLENRLRELAFLNSGVKIVLEDRAPGRTRPGGDGSTRAACGNS
jgi:DNA gyrase subunit B